MSAKVAAARAPYREDLGKVVGQADSLLFKQGSLSSSWDNVICAALQEEFGAQVALSPGYKCGRTILPGDVITRADLYALCEEADIRTWQNTWTGEYLLKVILAREAAIAVGQIAFPGRDMTRFGGLEFVFDQKGGDWDRVSDVRLLADNSAIQPDARYRVAGWGIRRGTTNLGPPLWKILENYITKHRRVGTERVTSVTLKSTN